MDRNFQDLLKRYNEGSVSPEEKKQIETWYLSLGEKPQSIDQEALSRHLAEGRNELQKIARPKRITPVWKRIAAAAAVLLIVAGIYLLRGTGDVSELQMTSIDSILPGEETAILRMTNGQDVDLKAMAVGTTFSQGGMEIVKLSTGGIQIKQFDVNPESIQPSIIRTPVGGEFEVTLPDGSLVKLNADSELKLLGGYNKEDRKIDLLGEAFFDVQKSTKPFIVNTANQKVTVLGTQFNIKAYANELNTTTRLLRGSVKVSNSTSGKEILMKPGDEVINRGHELMLSAMEKIEVDWVNREFVFNNKTAEELMNDIARWYNLEVVFEKPELKAKVFSGKVKRYAKFDKVMSILNATEAFDIEVEGRKVTIKEYN